jgi:hypothetical protein
MDRPCEQLGACTRVFQQSLTCACRHLQGADGDLRAQLECAEKENKDLKLQLESQYQTMIHMTETIAKTHLVRIRSAAAEIPESNSPSDLQVREPAHMGWPGLQQGTAITGLRCQPIPRCRV